MVSPQTLLLGAKDYLSATPTGKGVRLLLASPAPPVVGSAVVLPRSPSLVGGFLGIVKSVGKDGKTLELVAGGISDAFEYYDLAVPDIQGGDPLPAGQAAANGPLGKSAAGMAPANPVAPADRKPIEGVEGKAQPMAAQPLAAGLSACIGGNAAKEVTASFSKTLTGHFNATISKYSFFGKQIPTGATLDMSIAATVAASLSVDTSVALSCSADVGSVLIPIAQAPVPLSFYFSATAAVTVGGGVKVTHTGAAVTAGVKFAGHLGLTDGASFSGGPILTAAPLTPKVEANGKIGLKVGGQIIVGPGAGTVGAGVIAGIGGELNPVDASFGAVFPVGDPRFNACLKAEGAFTRSLSLTAKAWVGKWDISKSVTVDALKGSTAYPGSPWYYPAGCKDAQTPSDSVLGDGVTKIDDKVIGGQTQWGYLPGFVPGKKTWVLSTGNIADAVGVPSKFASTDLGGVGDSDLAAFAGRPTYDAVAYQVTLVPTGPNLHVRYVFASEEYPEYVGSAFNDVMAVFVNGVNCANVPGTNQPVSVNTVNADVNSAYFIDNQAGSVGLWDLNGWFDHAVGVFGAREDRPTDYGQDHGRGRFRSHIRLCRGPARPGNLV